MGSKGGLGGETFAADGALEGPVLGSLQLGVVVTQVLLQVGQLDEGPAALGHVTSVRSLTLTRQDIWSSLQFRHPFPIVKIHFLGFENDWKRVSLCQGTTFTKGNVQFLT